MRSRRRRSAALGVLGPKARQQTTAWGIDVDSAPFTSRGRGGPRASTGGKGKGVTIDGVYFPPVQELLERRGLVL